MDLGCAVESIPASDDLRFGYTLETTQGQKDGFFSQLLFNWYLPRVASVGD